MPMLRVATAQVLRYSGTQVLRYSTDAQLMLRVATASKLVAATSQTAELFAPLFLRNGGMCEFHGRPRAACLL